VAESDKENGKKKYVCMTGEDFRKTVGGLTQDTLRDPKTGEVILDEKTNKPKLGEKRVANMKAFKEVISDLCVLARSSPDDKYLLVTGI
jgi:Ca2+ transporting ATPase